MFGKVKQFVLNRAFDLAFMRYDRNGTQTLDPNQLTSLVNDVFALLKIPKQVSWLEVGIIVKMLDLDGDSQLGRNEVFDACRGALAKFGGVGGIMKFFGKTGSPMTIGTNQSNSAPVDPNYHPPQNIDQNMLQNLPPVGQNLKPEDLKNYQQPQQIQWPQQGNSKAWQNWGDEGQNNNQGGQGFYM